ncbi:Ima1 N-terminal domain-containing protein [Pseudomassariella vexata]|uniref:Ima1 N-terminal domain-domain-containing protein n=1 Tax=Pseudomassariella vexata TaxID=1141098 RepID=A0A1Y2DCP9_9PEZI|nr:Ima1 N-terminal domain-containing protein [Pseudomassariella vexata]ORY56914.1 Ima1 N-terminal domain-domain-containing protein [Pseudomassariella vexata]
MPVLRSRKALSCFYCGKRSSLKFEGQRSFDCAHCEATNWLDEQGQITDPPAPAAQNDRIRYAVSRASSAPRQMSSLSPEPDDPIFCATCLRNQRLVTESLRQYEFPDDPQDPEYATRERAYRKWRRGLEERYPQVCAKCEPKVREKLDAASYTAKTDHLRRMMDRTEKQLQTVKRRGFLDVVDTAGRWSWHIAFVIQFLWHITVLLALFVRYASQNKSDSRALQTLTAACAVGMNLSPSPERLMKWAVNMSMCAFPWNPRFKQSIRGFTSHILGFRRWYTYQLVILFIRGACLFISQSTDSDSKGEGMSTVAQLGAHIVIASFMLHLHKVAEKSIHTDTTPLFGSSRPPRSMQSSPQEHVRERDPSDLGNILDDIAAESAPMENVVSPPISHFRPSHRELYKAPSPAQSTSFSALPQRHHPQVALGSLSLSDSPTPGRMGPQQPPVYADEMDWSPSGSQHRAFSTHNPFKIKNPNPRFNDAPLEPKPGPFWYKIPPAPTNPAQRARNPPRPVIRQSPKEVKESIFRYSPKRPLDLGTGRKDSDSGLVLQDPKFYAPPPADDPRDGLTSILGSFSISPSPDELAFSSNAGGRPRSSNDARPLNDARPVNELQNDRRTRQVELAVLLGALYAWIAALGTDKDYARFLDVSSVIVLLLISVRLAGDLLHDVQVKEGRIPSSFALSSVNLGITQVLATLALLWGLWTRDMTGLTYELQGNVLFGVTIAHHIWHAFA